MEIKTSALFSGVAIIIILGAIIILYGGASFLTDLTSGAGAAFSVALFLAIGYAVFRMVRGD